MTKKKRWVWTRKRAAQVIVTSLILFGVSGIVYVKKQDTAGTEVAGVSESKKDINKLYDASYSYEELKKAGKPVIIDFTASWCVPCKTFNPLLEKTKEKYGDDIVIKIIDVDENTDYVSQFPVKVIPSQILLDANGNQFKPIENANIFGFKYYEKGEGTGITLHEGAIEEAPFFRLVDEMKRSTNQEGS